MPMPQRGQRLAFSAVMAFSSWRQSAGCGSNSVTGTIGSLAAERQSDCAVAVGKKAEVADALETGRQRMNEKTPDELAGVNRHDFRVLSVFVFIVLPLERDLAVFVWEKALIGYGDAVRRAAQVFDCLLGTAEGRFCINYPFEFDPPVWPHPDILIHIVETGTE
jgi:hypothetical protein